jgi:nucleotide-binding universal stress UspA family protein
MFRQLLKEPGITTAWRAEVGYPDAVMAKHARRADLIVAYRTRGDADTSVYATPDDLVMEAGLPVLLLPTNEAEFQAKAVLLAWKNTPEMRRAISVAMPVLRDAERVLVAAVCRAAQIMAVEQELADVAERLAKNGVRATVLAQAAAPGAAGPKLRGIAEAHGSDLIVAGAYGHSRLREWMLGGATRDLIADGRRYVLLSH